MPPAPFAVSVGYATSDGTALAQYDYLPVSGRLHFTPGTVEQFLLVPVVGDRFGEPTETFHLLLAEPDNAILGRDQAIATVLDDDPSALSIEPMSVVEGDFGTTDFVVTVRLVPVSDETVVVRFVSEDVTALAGEDYEAVAGELVFPPGISARTIPMRVFGDRLNEADETFLVRLLEATGAPIGTDIAVCRIVNDDPAPSLTIVSGSVSEGHTGFQDLRFPVHLSAPSGQTVTVDFATSDGTAVAGSDYLATQGTLTFPPGNADPGPLYLGADAGGGRTGFSRVFELVHDDDLMIALQKDRALAYVGDTVQLWLTVTNTGPGLATGVVATNLLPAGLSFASASATVGTWSRTGSTVRWNLGELPGGSGATLTLGLTPNASGTWTNFAGLGRDGSDAWGVNNTASVALAVDGAADHFVFEPLTEMPQVNIPFPVTIAAKNASNRTVTSFNGAVTLRASRLFAEDFEDGWGSSRITPWCPGANLTSTRGTTM